MNWGLRDYGIPGQLGLEPTIAKYISNMVAVFDEVRRVLREDGVCFVNIGDSYAGSWGNYHPNSPPGKHGQRLKQTARWNRGAYESQDFLPPTANNKEVKPKDLCLIPERLAIALQDSGWWVRQIIIWSKPNPMPESVRDRCTTSHEYIILLAKSQRYFWDQEAVKESANKGAAGSRFDTGKTGVNGNGRTQEGYRDSSGRNLRSVWTIPTSPFPGSHFAVFPPELVRRAILAGTSQRGCCSECGKPWERVVEKPKVGDWSKKIDRMGIGQNPASSGDEVIRINGSPYRKDYKPPTTTGWRPTCNHNAPTKPCTVLDPFGGAGTTALVANQLGRRAILIELNPEYCDMAKSRIVGDAPLFYAGVN